MNISATKISPLTGLPTGRDCHRRAPWRGDGTGSRKFQFLTPLGELVQSRKQLFDCLIDRFIVDPADDNQALGDEMALLGHFSLDVLWRADSKAVRVVKVR